MKTKHKFHKVLQWIADGEEIEVLVGNQWCRCSDESVMNRIVYMKDSHSVSEFRIKPKEFKLFFTGIEQELSRDKQTTLTLKIFDECPTELEEIFKEGKPVKIVSEHWYNEQINKR